MNKIVLNGEVFDLGGGQSQEIYSTEETRIGTWIDGKPLYRIVGTGSTPKSTIDWAKISSPIDNLKEVVGIRGLLRKPSSNSYFPMCYPGSMENGTKLAIEYDDGVYVTVSDESMCNCTVTFILEYIKTTDAAPQSVSSEVIPKSSGTITRDGVQYDYELPDIVSAASSAAQNNISSR